VRLDLFLKTSRLVKRRTVAQELCGSGSVLVNGQSAKPGRIVRTGDRITLRFPSRTIEVEIISVPLTSKRPASDPLTRVLHDVRAGEDDTL
jgi:ribosomal 50S subunit-recycling heat shock protein